jgi:hypothetical protein
MCVKELEIEFCNKPEIRMEYEPGRCNKDACDQGVLPRERGEA